MSKGCDDGKKELVSGAKLNYRCDVQAMAPDIFSEPTTSIDESPVMLDSQEGFRTTA